MTLLLVKSLLQPQRLSGLRSRVLLYSHIDINISFVILVPRRLIIEEVSLVGDLLRGDIRDTGVFLSQLIEKIMTLASFHLSDREILNN